MALGQHQGVRSVAAAEVEEMGVRGRCRIRRLQQEELGSRVDALPGEDAAVGGEVEGEVGQRQPDGGRCGSDLRLGFEVVGQVGDGTLAA
jgi:hypothetical protein